MKKRLALMLGLAVPCLAASTCTNSRALLGRGHLDIGVRLVGNSEFQSAEISALDYWAKALDMSWHPDATASCAIAFQPSTLISRGMFGSVKRETVAAAHMPGDRNYDGVVYFRYANGYDKTKVFEHELGHIFGLDHNSDNDSVMYFEPSESSGELTVSDRKALAKSHTLR